MKRVEPVAGTQRRANARIIRRAASAASLALLVWLAVGSVASAASPAWKMLAFAGPTNLPPVQSETQQVSVEAEGGSFALTAETAFGEGSVATHQGEAEVTEGSVLAKVISASEPFAVGEQISSFAFPFGTKIVTISGSPVEPVLEMSAPAVETVAVESLTSTSNVVTGVSTSFGDFRVGDEISGEFGSFPAGTTVTSVESGSLTLSEYANFGGLLAIKGLERTSPISFNADAASVQMSLSNLPGLTGAVSVAGGPGGTAGTPYSLMFGGRFANMDIPAVAIDKTALVGAHSEARVSTPVSGGAGTGEIAIYPANIGGAPTLGEFTVELGPLPEGITVGGPAQGTNWNCIGGSGSSAVSCTSEETIPGLRAVQSISVPIEVTATAEMETSVPVKMSGGGAETDSVQVALKVSRTPAKNGVAAIFAGAFGSDGKPAVQAGGHPYSAVTYFALNTVRLRNGRIVPPGDPKDIVVDLPPGLSGDPLVTPRCPQGRLVPLNSGEEDTPLCTMASSIGVLNPIANEFGTYTEYNSGIFNDVPANGFAAEFTTIVVSPLDSLLASVRSSEDFGIRIKAPNTPTVARIYGAFVALKGNPTGAGGKAFLTNASSCAENARQAPLLGIQNDTWQAPGLFSPKTTVANPAVTGCDLLTFTPDFSFHPTITTGSSGTGAVAQLHVPQEGLTDPVKLATPDLKKAVVKLPAGLTLNPSSAKGLQACSESQMGLVTTTGELPNPIRFDEEPVTCPDGSKLGTVEVDSPLIESPLVGTIYLAKQEENPFHSFLAIYLVVEDARTGIKLKLPGELQVDGATGQLTASFDYNPQLAFEDLKLTFRGGGPQSELATPEICGHYETTGSLEPWSAPESGPPFQITEGGFDISNGCSSSAAARPFAPAFEAGTTTPRAGSYSPLVIKVSRKDGEQELKSLDFTLPKGLLAKLAGVPYCPEGAIQNAEHKSGKEEQVSASCPAASRIGSVDTAAGVGSEPFHVSGSVYLAGPYKGAPLSSVVVTPAVAGPFDLGDVVVRAPLYVNPESAEVTAKSDPIPTILKGIPLKLRSVTINLDRTGFALNPTSCSPMTVGATIGGSNGASATPAKPFQVEGCDALKFKPSLKISLKGATKRTGLPALKAVVTYPKQGAYANIQRAQVNLPHSEFLEQNNLSKTCTKPFLLEGNCPKSTIYGKAKAWSPLLDRPLQGPVYLVGGYGYKLPALVADLNGQIRVLLKGKVDSGPNKGIRATFEMVPDAPVSRFVLEMKGGKKYGLLINSEGLCGRKQRANSLFRAQNGLVQHTKPLIANQCGKRKKKHSSR